VLSPEKVVEAGWDKLVGILDRGGYVRYDFKTATKLLDVSRVLLQEYNGDLNSLYSVSRDSSDLEKRLKNLGKGIGDVTINILLRELRGIWRKAVPLPSELTIEAANELGILSSKNTGRARALDILTAAWLAEGMKMKEFPEFEAALVRYGKAFRKTHRGLRKPSES
jgi:hypothetical protein